MNEQQRAELERIRDVLYPATGLEDYDEEIIGRVLKDINALLAQDAQPKQDVPETNFGNMAEPKIGCVNHDCDKCKAAQPDYAWPTIEQRAVIQQMVDALDHADELLGGNDTLVMNGAAAGRWLLEQPAVQEPVFCEYCGGNDDADFGLPTDHCTDCARPQPVPVKTYHDGKPWPVAPKPWVGLTDEDKQKPDMGEYVYLNDDWMDGYKTGMEYAEAKLKENNHG